MLWRAKFFTTAEADGFTGRPGEITYDVTRKRASYHDGVTQGGIGLSPVVIPIGGDVTFNPSIGTTYYIGAQWGAAVDATKTNVMIHVPRGGRVRSVFWAVNVAGTLSSGDPATMGIEILNSSGQVLSNPTGYVAGPGMTWDTAFSTGVHSVSLTAPFVPEGGHIVGRIDTPGWAGVPTTVRVRGYITID
jgi:hypothetical protein